MTKFVLSLHESYKTGMPIAHGGFHGIYDTKEEAEEAVNLMVDEDIDALENNLGRYAVLGDDYYDSISMPNVADCFRCTSIDNSETFYYIDEIEI